MMGASLPPATITSASPLRMWLAAGKETWGRHDPQKAELKLTERFVTQSAQGTGHCQRQLCAAQLHT